MEEKNTIKDIQEHLFSILCCFHEICCQKKINYYLMFGTALGAVRHRDFIPWDDDVDVGVSAKDFYALARIPRKYFSEHGLELKLYHSGCLRLIDKNTTIVTQRNITTGLWVDIFLMNGTPNIPLLRKAFLSIEKFCFNMAVTKDIPDFKLNTFYNKLTSFTASFFTKKELHFILKKLYLMFPYEGSEMLFTPICMGYSNDYHLFPKECYGTPTIAEFHGKQFFIPEKVEKYLRLRYGDYMKLPPYNLRQPNHQKYVNLYMPYKSFKKDGTIK